MGRKALKATAPAVVVVNEATVGKRDLALIEAQHATALALSNAKTHALSIGYSLPGDVVDADLIERDISVNMARSVQAVLEVGRGLSVLKLACGHGNFLERLDRLGIDARLAQRMMRAGEKFSRHGGGKLVNALGNRAKLFEMLVLDDEELDTLEASGELGPLKLDDISTMSMKELREALRQARADAAFAEDKIRREGRRADDAERKLFGNAATVAPADERLNPLRQAVAKSCLELTDAARRQWACFEELQRWVETEVTSAPDYDPQRYVPLTGGALSAVTELHRAVEAASHLIAHMKATLEDEYGMEIEQGRRHVLVADGLHIKAEGIDVQFPDQPPH